MKNFQHSSRAYQKATISCDLATLFLILISNILYIANFDVGRMSRTSPFLIITVLPFIWIFSLVFSGAWKPYNLFNLRSNFSSLLQSSAIATLLFCFLCYVLKDPISRLFVAANITVILILILICRLIILENYKRKVLQKIQQKLVYVGTGNSFESLYAELEGELGNNFLIYRFNPGEYFESEIIDSLSKYLIEKNANVMFVEYGSIKNPLILNGISRLHTLGLSEIIIESKLTLLSSRLSIIPGTNYFRISDSELSDGGATTKRLLDIALGILFIALFSPFFFLIAILIKFSSKGPILYWSNRVGQNNKVFHFPKFRTMVVGSDLNRNLILGDDLNEIKNNYKNDPRITKIGKFLRRWSFDETPQLLLVLKGTMSIVGPRPILVEELKLIPKEFQYRFIAKPGLTGLWQVSGRKEVDWVERMHQDVSYIETWTFGRDLLLIFKTFGAILSGKGSY